MPTKALFDIALNFGPFAFVGGIAGYFVGTYVGHPDPWGVGVFGAIVGGCIQYFRYLYVEDQLKKAAVEAERASAANRFIFPLLGGPERLPGKHRDK